MKIFGSNDPIGTEIGEIPQALGSPPLPIESVSHPAAPVDSVNGQTGVVVLDADDIDDSATTQKFVNDVDIGDVSFVTSSDQYDFSFNGVPLLRVINGTFAVQDGNNPSMSLGADFDANTITDATPKRGILVTPHYLTAEEDLAVLISTSTPAANNVGIGGGSPDFNTATRLLFYAAANTTTLTGNPARLIIDAVQADFAVPVGLPEYTVASLPSASPAGQTAYISNGAAGNPAFGIADGTNWKVIDISALSNASAT